MEKQPGNHLYEVPNPDIQVPVPEAILQDPTLYNMVWVGNDKGEGAWVSLGN